MSGPSADTVTVNAEPKRGLFSRRKEGQATPKAAGPDKESVKIDAEPAEKELQPVAFTQLFRCVFRRSPTTYR